MAKNKFSKTQLLINIHEIRYKAVTILLIELVKANVIISFQFSTVNN